MKKIIVPIDFSATSEKAVRYIENVFKDQLVKMELIYVSAPEAEADDKKIKSAFNKFETAILKESPIPYSFHILQGNLLEEIQKTIHKFHPAFVIMGTHKASLANALVKLTDCPILVIPDKSSKSAIKKIGYANDFNDIKVSSALEPLLTLSQSLGAMVHIIHVGDENVTKDKAEEAIEYYLDRVDHEYVFINSNNIVTAIQDYLDKNDIDLLAVLIRDHGGNELHSRGALVEQLVTNTNVPLLNLI